MPQNFSGPRYNEFIQSPKVRVIDHEGENLGVMLTAEAIEAAAEVGLDLVEVSPNADPPVAKFLDVGKYKYEAQKKANAARKNPRKVKILGGSAAERRLVRKLLVRYAHHTHIVKVTLRSSVAGRGITTSYRFKSNRILSGRSRIVIQTGGGFRRLRQVATHEIAHASQLWAYRGTTLTRTRVIFNRTFGGTGSTGLERGADCAVIAIGERSSALPYQNSCTRAQRRAARGVLAGRRIQQR